MEFNGVQRIRRRKEGAEQTAPFSFCVFCFLRGRNDCEQLADICSKELLNDTLRATIESTIIK